MKTLLDLGEREILRTIIPRFVAAAGDDCAAIPLPIGHLVATTDPVPPPAAASIGNDPDPFWMGWLLVTINASDLAAAGAQPLAFLAAVECAPDMEVGKFERLLEGIRAACSEAGLEYVGGNLREAQRLSAVGIGLGLCHPQKPLSRRGACDGDVVVSIGQGGVFWRDALRLLDNPRAPINKGDSPLFKPRSQIGIMHRAAAAGLVRSAMDNSDGLLPSLNELSEKNQLGIELDLELLSVPDLSNDEESLAPRLWLGWGDWNVIACVSPDAFDALSALARSAGYEALRIGKCSSHSKGVTLHRFGNAISAPRLESERFARDSWILKGIGEYVRMLREVPLP